eukprot:13737874-Alexandrium_andersonii.AAC.1
MSTAPSWTQRWMSLVVLDGPARRHPAPDSAAWTVRHRRPESASSCGRTAAQSIAAPRSVAASGGPVAGGRRRPPASSSLLAT